MASVEEREARRMPGKSAGDHRFCVHAGAAFVLEASDCLVPAVWGRV